MIGQKFGRLRVLRLEGGYAHCVCDCGADKRARQDNVRCGATQSCGCLNREAAAARKRTHGLSTHPLHVTWGSVIQRCSNPNQKNWPRYGGRGIRVCGRWMTFENFYADMGPTWAPGLTIERKDNDGDYEPSNCVWASMKEQTRNRRSNVWYVGPDGQQLVATDLARVLGVTHTTVANRTRAGTLPPGWSKA